MDQFAPRPAPEPIALDSSRIASMSYDEDDQTLEIEFTRGGTYVYRGIPQPLAEGLKRAESPGR